jgi:hypothetical protein
MMIKVSSLCCLGLSSFLMMLGGLWSGSSWPRSNVYIQTCPMGRGYPLGKTSMNQPALFKLKIRYKVVNDWTTLPKETTLGCLDIQSLTNLSFPPLSSSWRCCGTPNEALHHSCARPPITIAQPATRFRIIRWRLCEADRSPFFPF